MARWPTGIRPSESGSGLRIKVWKHGKLVYSETVPGDPYHPPDLAAAVKRRDDLLAKLRLGHRLRSDDTGAEIFGDAAQRWLSSLQISDGEIRKAMNQLNRYWMPAYASWAVNEITAADIRERLAGFGLKIKTQKNILGPLRGVLRHAGVYPNPAYQITWPRRESRRQKPVVIRYRPEERDRVIGALDRLASETQPENQSGRSKAHWRREAAIYFPLLFATGLRPGEALGLDWCDYDGQWLNVETQRNRGQERDATKTGRRRRVYVPAWVRPRLDAHPTRFAGGAIFVGFRGGSLKDTKRINKVWTLAHTKARVPLRDPYTCRHTRAAELLSRGVMPAEAAAELGHSVRMFLDTYSEWIAEYCQDRDLSRLEGCVAIGRSDLRETREKG